MAKIKGFEIKDCISCLGDNIVYDEDQAGKQLRCTDCGQNVVMFKAEHPTIDIKDLIHYWDLINTPEPAENPVSEYIVIYEQSGNQIHATVDGTSVLSAIGNFYNFYNYHIIIGVLKKES